MEIREAQKRIDKWIKEVGGGYFSPLTNMAVLTEETGELARIMARRFGDQRSKKGEDTSDEALADELADVMRVVICLANQTGIDLDAAIERNINKIYTRDRDRFKTTDSNPDAESQRS